MNSQETRRLEMLTRVRDFGAARSALFPPASRGGQLLATIGAVVDELGSHSAVQTAKIADSREGTTSKAVARAALTEAIEAINLTARAISLTTPGMDDQFRLPRRHSDQALLAAARSFAEEALPLKAEFISREMPANFIEELNEDILTFEAAISARNLSTGSQVEATAAIDEAIDRGMRAAQELNAIVQNKLRQDKPALAAWTSARHVERQSGSGGSKTGSPPPSTPQAPTP